MNIQLYDTTLREGKQTPGGNGCADNTRVAIAHYIADYADWVEVGMPANPVDFASIRLIAESFAEKQMKTGLAVLCRTLKLDIDEAVKALGPYEHSLAHLFVGVSDEHRKTRGRNPKSNSEYEKQINEMVRYAAEQPEFERVMFSPEDGIRAFIQNPDQTKRFIESGIKGHQKSNRKSPLVIDVPETTGGSTVSQGMWALEDIHRTFGDAIEICTHCHNDTGMAAAHSIEALVRGYAPWIQTTMGGLGERNGIPATENIIAILDHNGLISDKPYGHEEVLKKLVPTVITVNALLGRTIPAENPVSGSQTNTSTAGIHTDIAGKETATYHIFGERYGAKPTMEFGPVSGANQVIPVLGQIGMHKSKAQLGDLVERLKHRANVEQRIFTDSDLWYHAIREYEGVDDPLVVDDYAITVERDGTQPVTLKGFYQGLPFNKTVISNGPLEGVMEGLAEVVNQSVVLEKFSPEVVPKIDTDKLDWRNPLPLIDTVGVQSDFQVYCGIKSEGRLYGGYARDENTFRANVNSLIDAYVKMCTIQTWLRKKEG